MSDDLDPRLEAWFRALRREPPARADARMRLQTALRAEYARPARLALAPQATLLAAAVLVALASALWFGAERWSRPEAAPGLAEYEEFTVTQFVLHADDARSVTVVGDFNDWDPDATPLVQTEAGIWMVDLRLRPGTVRYSFLVDGKEWRADPRGVPAPSDFGRPTSIAFITPIEAS